MKGIQHIYSLTNKQYHKVIFLERDNRPNRKVSVIKNGGIRNDKLNGLKIKTGKKNVQCC